MEDGIALNADGAFEIELRDGSTVELKAEWDEDGNPKQALFSYEQAAVYLSCSVEYVEALVGAGVLRSIVLPTEPVEPEFPQVIRCQMDAYLGFMTRKQ